MAKRAVTSRFLKTIDGNIQSDGRGKDGYYRELAGVDVSSDDEVCHNYSMAGLSV